MIKVLNVWIFIRGVAVAALGGSLFFWMGMPLPWVMGSMVATIIAGLAGLKGYMPRSVRNCAIPALGVMFGAAFDGQALTFFPSLWVLIPVILIYLVAVITIGCIWFMWVGKLDFSTAYFASVPGSFSEMVFLAEERGARLSPIAMVHSIRQVLSLTLITVAFRTLLDVDTTQIWGMDAETPGSIDFILLTLCAVVGYFGGKAVRLPSPYLFGPLIVSAAAHLTGLIDIVPPKWVVACAQIFIGIFVGLRFSDVKLAMVRQLFMLAVVWAFFLVLSALGLAGLAILILDLPFETAFLAFAPGGAVEISTIAMAAGLSLSLITIIQFMRIVMIILLVPLFFRLLPQRKSPH